MLMIVTSMTGGDRTMSESTISFLLHGMNEQGGIRRTFECRVIGPEEHPRASRID